ncbi:MAG: hypothetical protein AB1540_08475 [Bdellovibrionota bacterium]
MSPMSPGFYFKNCEIADEVESYANTCLSRVMDLAPYGASVSAVLEKSGDKYSGHIEVCSKWGPFFVSVVGNDPKLTIDRLLEKMQEKLETWHSRRFYARSVEAPLLTQ